ncbi:MAG: cytochrome P450 [Gammaproteobacteria bacterium]|nr:cytochrome P450 [Gammaproteobacteria bacterium]
MNAPATSLADLDPSDPTLQAEDTWRPVFKRLRAEAPLQYTADTELFGSFWSVTRYQDIRYVDTHHDLFSSETGIVIGDQAEDFELPMFIAMDPPKHDEQRKVVSPVVAPMNLKVLESTIRSRACAILDDLPRGETFNWVERVSIELTTQMLATLFDFPFEDRRRLTRWSDVATARPGMGIVETEEQRREELYECLACFTDLWNQRVNAPPGNDLISMLAHGEATQNMSPQEYLGNLLLLIVGGNDTTRNSISGGVLAFNRFPDELAKLRGNPKLLPNAVSEIIRWQTPLAHMRRRATQDIEMHGQTIRKGDKVVMWYISGNRDEDVWERPDDLMIERSNARAHLAFGFGIHRCMGNRLAEMQLRIVWEEILRRFETIEVVGEPVRVRSNFVRGYSELPVRVT